MKRKETNRNQFLPVTMFPALLIAIHLILTIHSMSEPFPYEPTDHFSYPCYDSEEDKWNHQYNPKLLYSSELHQMTVPKSSILCPGNSKFPDLCACIFEKQSSFTFPVSAGVKAIRFHFLPTSYPGFLITKALFSVTVDNFTLLRTSESSYLDNSSSVELTSKEFCINVDGPVLNITFTPRNSSGAYGFVNKIEIVSFPQNLYIQGSDVPLPLIGRHSKFPIENSTALEMMYRLNVGGDEILPQADTGMLRTWSMDTSYLFDSVNTGIVHQGDINFKPVPAYTAPLEVYATARTIRQPLANLSWSLPLESGFYYLIRLHFFEILSDVVQGSQRTFTLYINNHAAVIQQSAEANVPFYRDYVVNFSSHGHGVEHMLLTLKRDIGLKTLSAAPFLNGLEIFKLSDQTNNFAGLYPFGNGPQPRQDSSKTFKFSSELSMGFAALVVLFLMLFVLQNWWCRSVQVSPSTTQHKTFMQWVSSGYCHSFSLEEIKSATDNFSDANVVGAGGFGKVYKGCIDGETSVAVKRGSPSSHQGLNEFQTEITLLSKLRHCNLVSLIGYCKDAKEMILVYDFMARGTLRDHLYNNTQKSPLPWKSRLRICIDAGRGLQYLHKGTKQMIIHRDVKTTNILLDENCVAKVSDFGLSRVGPHATSNTHVSTLVKGTFGYVDPEYYRRQKLTEKSDVYSFGVVLFEVLCARPAVLPMVTMEQEEEELERVNLAEWALRCYQRGTLDQIIDPFLKGKIDPQCFKTFTEIAKQCLADKGNERPSMDHVLWNLELAMQQHELAEVGKEGRICSIITSGEVTVRVNGQEGLCFNNSDATPGVEFSEIMVPIGR